MTTQHIRVRGMSCAACQRHVEQALTAIPGVHSAHVDLMNHRAAVSAEELLPTEQLVAAVRRAGYDADASQPGSHDPEGDKGERWLGRRALFALCVGALAMFFSMPLMMSGPPFTNPLLHLLASPMHSVMPGMLLYWRPGTLRTALCWLTLAVVLLAAPDVYLAAWRAARHRSTNMNTLVALGTVVAFAASTLATVAPRWSAQHGFGTDVYYEPVDLILAFLLVGRWLEVRARKKATEAVRGFAALQPSDARLLAVAPRPSADELTAAKETLLPLDAVEVGDFVRVLPSERVPTDGVIVVGRSSVDESMITGEPLPVTREIGDRVLAGTLNVDGVLVFCATAVGSSSTLAQMERLLAEAQSQRASMQRLADRASAIFVPAVLALALLTCCAWFLILHRSHDPAALGRSLQAAVAVLVVACPCAMGLAVPAAVTVAVGSAARLGVLVKGGEVLERLARVDTCALDKTGTLTEGRPQIVSMQLAPAAQFRKDTLLRWAAAVERLSTHPLARAVVQMRDAEDVEPSTLQISGFEVLPGSGVRARVDGHSIVIGSSALLPEHDAEEFRLKPVNATPLHIMVDGQLEATLLATDTLRPTSAEALGELRKLGLSIQLLTGDTTASAHSVAQQVGVSDVHASLLPAGKMHEIATLQKEGHRVVMVGDGINDAAALAQADIGIAMASGTDLAREAGDVLLLYSDLRLIPRSVLLARQTVRIMRQNLGWAMGYNMLGLPVAAGLLYPHFHLLLSPALASAAMALSSVSVLLNSLRLHTSRGTAGL